jgi:hypothetical protein
MNETFCMKVAAVLQEHKTLYFMGSKVNYFVKIYLKRAV